MLTYGGAYSLDDPHLQKWVANIVRERGIDLIVETGTNVGLSTAFFASLVPFVVSIDVDLDCTDAATNHLISFNVNNVNLITGSSPDELRKMKLHIDDRTLLFLDAHMEPSTAWPIYDEIDAIPRGKGLIMMHDIKVPDRDFAFSQFVHLDGVQRDFTYESVREVLTAWSPTHSVSYNREAAGSRVGVALVTL